MKKIRLIGIALLGAVWLTLAAFAWFGPVREVSEAEPNSRSFPGKLFSAERL